MSEPSNQEPTSCPGDNGDVLEETPRAGKAAGRKALNLVIFGLIMLGAVLLLHYSPLGKYAASIENWKHLLEEKGLTGHLLFMSGIVVLLAMGFSRLVLVGFAGILLGFMEGFAVAQLGTVIGSWIAFAFARWGGRDWAMRKSDRFPKLRRYLAHPTVGGVFLARQLPLPAVVQNAVLGMSDVRASVFLLGTFLGYLPTNAAVSLMGSALGKEDPSKSIVQIITAVSLLAVVALFFLRRSSKDHADPHADP